MQLDTFQKVTHDGGVFETNVRRLIAICGQHLRWRKDLSGIDLDMLRDAQLAWTVEKDAKSFWDVKWKETPLLGDLEEREEPCLEYESDIRRSEVGQFVVRHARDLVPGDKDLALVRAVDAADQVEQGGLAAARGA